VSGVGEASEKKRRKRRFPLCVGESKRRKGALRNGKHGLFALGVPSRRNLPNKVRTGHGGDKYEWEGKKTEKTRLSRRARSFSAHLPETRRGKGQRRTGMSHFAGREGV